jgi:hypothetical protein
MNGRHTDRYGKVEWAAVGAEDQRTPLLQCGQLAQPGFPGGVDHGAGQRFRQRLGQPSFRGAAGQQDLRACYAGQSASDLRPCGYRPLLHNGTCAGVNSYQRPSPVRPMICQPGHGPGSILSPHGETRAPQKQGRSR